MRSVYLSMVLTIFYVMYVCTHDICGRSCFWCSTLPGLGECGKCVFSMRICEFEYRNVFFSSKAAVLADEVHGVFFFGVHFTEYVCCEVLASLLFVVPNDFHCSDTLEGRLCVHCLAPGKECLHSSRTQHVSRLVARKDDLRRQSGANAVQMLTQM